MFSVILFRIKDLPPCSRELKPKSNKHGSRVLFLPIGTLAWSSCLGSDISLKQTHVDGVLCLGIMTGAVCVNVGQVLSP